MKTPAQLKSTRDIVLIEPIYLKGDTFEINEANKVTKEWCEKVAVAKEELHFNCNGSGNYCTIVVQARLQQIPQITIKSQSLQCLEMVSDFLRSNSFL